ncbi:MAG: hypothetical protein ABIB79_02130 [archaeon]
MGKPEIPKGLLGVVLNKSQTEAFCFTDSTTYEEILKGKGPIPEEDIIILYVPSIYTLDLINSSFYAEDRSIRYNVDIVKGLASN